MSLYGIVEILCTSQSANNIDEMPDRQTRIGKAPEGLDITNDDQRCFRMAQGLKAN